MQEGSESWYIALNKSLGMASCMGIYVAPSFKRACIIKNESKPLSPTTITFSFA